MDKPIKQRERSAILQSLRAGVVPKIGLQHIQVGRKDEVEAIIRDLDLIAEGGSTVRLVIGRYGSGKSFLLNLSRILALHKRFVVVQADLTTDRRLYSRQGQARALYAELMQNMAVLSRPMGGAIASVVERWVSDVDFRVRESGGTEEDVGKEIHKRLRPLQDLVSGYDFANVAIRYLQGFHSQDDLLMAYALRWLRAQYTTKTEARQDLGVWSIIDDRNIYDYLKLVAAFVRMAGYAGLLVNIDEMGVLSHRLSNSRARNGNYEVLLRVVNDCNQGNVSGIGFLFAGTDSFLEDRRRGLYSYEALATRLAENPFAVEGRKDFSGPVIRIRNLSPEHLYVLLLNIRNVFASGDPSKHLVPDEALKEFMIHCSKKLGSDYYLTPREAAMEFVGFLSILDQNPEMAWKTLLSRTKTTSGADQKSHSRVPDDDRNGDLKAFKL